MEKPEEKPRENKEVMNPAWSTLKLHETIDAFNKKVVFKLTLRKSADEYDKLTLSPQSMEDALMVTALELDSECKWLSIEYIRDGLPVKEKLLVEDIYHVSLSIMNPN